MRQQKSKRSSWGSKKYLSDFHGYIIPSNDILSLKLKSIFFGQISVVAPRGMTAFKDLHGLLHFGLLRYDNTILKRNYSFLPWAEM